MGKRKQRDNIMLLVCTLILIFCEWFFFRNVIGNTKLFGDDGDGLLTTLITEHWFHVFKGEARLTELGFFYPIENTLAFSDMFLGFGIIHSIYRLLGMNVFIAYKWTLITVHVIGTISCFYLLKRTLKVSHFWAMFGTMAFSFSNAYAQALAHTQLVAISLVPLAGIFAVGFFNNLANRRRRNVCAYLTILTLVMILYTAWYIAFFSALFVAIVLVVWIIVSRANGLSPIGAIRDFYRTVRFDLLGYVIAFAALCAPFIYLEFTVARTYGSWNYDGVIHYLPEFIDIINVSRANWALGGAMEALQLDSRNIAVGEVDMGFALILLGLFIGFTILTVKHTDKALNQEGRGFLMLCRIIGIAVIVNMLLPIRLSSNGVSLWWFVYSIFPGGSSIRAVGRIFLFLSVPMAIITAVMGDYFWKTGSEDGRKRTIAKGIALLLLFLLNIRTEGASSSFDAEKKMDRLANVAVPPKDCEVCYLLPDEENKRLEAFAQLDMYMIADHFKLFTINGYTGVIPEECRDIYRLYNEGYESAVAKWITNHSLKNVYSYDTSKNIWTKFDVKEIADPCFCAVDREIPDLIYGLWDMDPSGNFSWTKQDFEVTLRDEHITKNGLLLKVHTYNTSEYLAQQPDSDLDYSIYVNDELIDVLHATGNYDEYRFDVPAAEDDLYTIKIKSDFYFNPNDLGISGDTRDLSLALYYLGAADS